MQVTFEMLGDDVDKTRAQLNNIRAKKTKFICLNDDMREPHADIQVSGFWLFVCLFFASACTTTTCASRTPISR